MRPERMEMKGIEQSPLTPSKTSISKSGGAKSGALKDDFCKKYPDFADIIDASNLPKDFKKVLIVELKTR
jgi:hypothetical protein